MYSLNQAALLLGDLTAIPMAITDIFRTTSRWVVLFSSIWGLLVLLKCSLGHEWGREMPFAIALTFTFAFLCTVYEFTRGDKTAEVRDLSKANSDNEIAKDALRQELDDMAKAKDEIEAVRDGLREQLDDARARNECDQRKMCELRGEMKAVRSDASNAMGENAAAQAALRQELDDTVKAKDEIEAIKNEIRGQLEEAMAQSERDKREIAVLKEELDNEQGPVIAPGFVGWVESTFAYNVVATTSDSEEVRHIHIQCPGVQEADITGKLIFNGIEVTIDKKDEFGIPACNWTKRFRFKTSDGIFDFKAEEAKLQHGVFTMVFRASKLDSRIFRFAPHYSMSMNDTDRNWYMEEDDAVARPGDDAAGNAVRIHGSEDETNTAPGRMQHVRCGGIEQASTLLRAETSASHISSARIEQMRIEAHLAADMASSTSFSVIP